MNDAPANFAAGASVLAALISWLPTLGLVASIVASILAAVASGYVIAHYRRKK